MISEQLGCKNTDQLLEKIMDQVQIMKDDGCNTYGAGKTRIRHFLETGEGLLETG
jgi:hypothetical protein